MPFDGIRYEGRNPALDKMDKVIDLLSDERRWCKRQLRSPDGRYCVLGAIQAAGAVAELKAPVLLAIEQVTGHVWRIEDFNDIQQRRLRLVLEWYGKRGRMLSVAHLKQLSKGSELGLCSARHW